MLEIGLAHYLSLAGVAVYARRVWHFLEPEERHCDFDVYRAHAARGQYQFCGFFIFLG